MNILWFTWKDGRHPEAGGAETVNEELAKRLARDGHRVLFIVGGFPGGGAHEKRDGFEIVRLGNRYTVYWKAFLYYRKHLSNESFDIVIDEVNTAPFFTSIYTKAKRHLLFVHQLCREIWFHQILFPVNVIGFLVEPIYLWFLRKNGVITVSESTKRDLIRYGFQDERIAIIPEGLDIEPVASLDAVEKYEAPTLLSLGAIRSMKRTLDQLRAFEIAKKSIPNLRFLVAGNADGRYGKKFLEAIEKSSYKDDIELLGRVSTEKKTEIMRKSHLISVTSVKEGWGLIVSEAASQGTPAVVYTVDGLRDSVRDGETGRIIAENTPDALAEGIVNLLENPSEYERLRRNALDWSRELTFDRSYESFLEILKR